MRNLHFTPFSVLGVDLPTALKLAIKIPDNFTGERSQVHAILRTAACEKLIAAAMKRQAVKDAEPRVFLADKPLRMSMRERDCF